HRRRDMNTPGRVNAIHRDCDVEREREAEKLIQKTKPHFRAPLQKSAYGQRNKKCADKGNQGGGSSLRIERKGRHRLVGRIILSRPRPDKRCGCRRPGGRMSILSGRLGDTCPRRGKLAYSRFRFAISSRRRMMSLRRSSFLRFT